MKKVLALVVTLVCQAHLAWSAPEERLAQAVQFATISHQDASRVDREAFGAFKQFLLDR